MLSLLLLLLLVSRRSELLLLPPRAEEGGDEEDASERDDAQKPPRQRRKRGNAPAIPSRAPGVGFVVLAVKRTAASLRGVPGVVARACDNMRERRERREGEVEFFFESERELRSGSMMAEAFFFSIGSTA